MDFSDCSNIIHFSCCLFLYFIFLFDFNIKKLKQEKKGKKKFFSYCQQKSKWKISMKKKFWNFVQTKQKIFLENFKGHRLIDIIFKKNYQLQKKNWSCFRDIIFYQFKNLWIQKICYPKKVLVSTHPRQVPPVTKFFLSADNIKQLFLRFVVQILSTIFFYLQNFFIYFQKKMSFIQLFLIFWIFFLQF